MVPGMIACMIVLYVTVLRMVYKEDDHDDWRWFALGAVVLLGLVCFVVLGLVLV